MPFVVQSKRRANYAQGTLSAESDQEMGTEKAKVPSFIEYRRAFSPMRLPQDTFTLAEKFDGVVLSVDDETFVARLFPSEADTGPAEAEFSRKELSEADQPLLFPGAPFVLTIGYRQSGSRLTRESSFYMRRLPTWSDEELNQAAQRAKTFSETVGWK